MTYITANIHKDKKVIINASSYLESLGQATAVLGVIIIFFDLSIIAGLLFLVIGLLGLTLYVILMVTIAVSDDDYLKDMPPEEQENLKMLRKLFPLLLDMLEGNSKSENNLKETETKDD